MLEKLFVTEITDTNPHTWLLSFNIPDSWNEKESLEIDKETARTILKLKSLQHGTFLDAMTLRVLQDSMFEWIPVDRETDSEKKLRKFVDNVLKDKGIYIIS